MSWKIQENKQQSWFSVLIVSECFCHFNLLNYLTLEYLDEDAYNGSECSRSVYFKILTVSVVQLYSNNMHVDMILARLRVIFISVQKTIVL